MTDKRVPPPDLGTLSGPEAQSFLIGVNAVIWGYPAVLFEDLMAGRSQPDSEARTGTPRSLVNQFGRVRHLRGPEYKQIATPNNDTLFIQSFVDVTSEPLILSVPDLPAARYYVLQLWDANGDTFDHIGTRVTGNGAGRYALTGPGWAGPLPQGVTRINCPPCFAIWGRVAVYGSDDLEIARAIQDQITLTPLSCFSEHRSDETAVTALSEARVAMDLPQGLAPELAVFAKLARALRHTPPKPLQDDVIVDQLSLIGFSDSGRSFHPDRLTPAQISGLTKAVPFAQHLMDVTMQTVGNTINGWRWSPRAGIMGTDYLFRACWAKWFTGGNLPDEAIYMICRTDASHAPLVGTTGYRLRFAPGALPPARAFWSLSMYDAADGSFVANAIERYSIGDRTAGLDYDPDGGLTLAIGHSPPDSTANWLPAPEGAFYLMLRLYLPTDALASGTWEPPGLE